MASDALRKCPFCGASLRSLGSPGGAPVNRAMPQFVAPVLAPAPLLPCCTLCACQDVRKVSNIFAQGAWRANSSTTFSSVGYVQNVGYTDSFGVGHVDTRGMSQLAAVLAPPARPRPRSSSIWVLGLLALAVSPCAAAPFLSVLGSGSGDASNAAGDAAAQAPAGLAVVGVLIVLAALAAFIWSLTATSRRNAQLAPENAEYEGQWNYLMDIWEGCYYCPKCDSVIEPRSGVTAPSVQFQQMMASFRKI